MRKSTKTDNTKVESLLNRVNLRKGTAHWGNVYKTSRSYSFIYNTGSMVSVTKNSYVGEPTYYVVKFYPPNEYRPTFLKCTNQRGKKLYDAIMESFKIHGKPPYTNWEY